MRDRGQSEVVGYVLVFAVVVLMVGIVSVAGQAHLSDVRDDYRTRNVEEGFSVLAENVDAVADGKAPSRATELGLADAQLSFGDPVRISVNVTGRRELSYEVRPIVYRADDGTRLVYVAGAVVRSDRGKAAMLREPGVVASERHAVIRILDTRRDRSTIRREESHVGGRGRALIRTERSNVTLLQTTDARRGVTVNVTSPRAAAWKRYFDGALPGDDCVRSGDTVSCRFTADRTHVVLVGIDVSFE